MNTSTKLIIVLTISVSAVMALASIITLRQREAILTSGARDVAMAHALTLQKVLEEYISTGTTFNIQEMINDVGNNPGVFGVLLFDKNGKLEKFSNTLSTYNMREVEQVRHVIKTGDHVEYFRQIGNEAVFSIILPLHEGDEIVGAVEIAQPISFVNDDINRARINIALTAVLLCLTIFLVVLFVTRYNIAKPINELLGGALALGKGDLNYRVVVPNNKGEIARLASEFNRMADHLSDQRASAEKEAEERLSLERQLRHNERLVSVGRLAAGVAHELGAPLQVIDGRAKQLINQPDASIEMQQRNLNIIRNQAERITNTVKQLLTLSRPYILRARNIDMPEFIAGLVEMLDTNASKAGVRIKTIVREGTTTHGDPDLLIQVFTNICFNAIQAMPDGGTLTIECLPENNSPKGDDNVVIKVSDTGTGISEDTLVHIFDPFFTTKEVGSGTGLGLAVSKRIIEEHEGRIEANNTPDGGACFTLYLPKSNTDSDKINQGKSSHQHVKEL